MHLIKFETLQNRISRLALFLIMFLSSGFLVSNDAISSSLTKVLWFLLFAVLLFLTKRVSFGQVIFFVVTNLLIIVSTIVNQDKLINVLYICFSYATVLLYSQVFSVSKFKKHYSDVVYFLAIVSLFFYVLYILFPKLSTLFNVVNASDHKYSSLIIYIHSTNIGSTAFYRNMGMFWEPGAYQFFLSLACFFEIQKQEPLDVKRTIVFLITLFTTFSTTAYIAILVLVVAWVINAKKTKSRKSFIWLLITLICILFIVYFNPDLFFNKAEYTVFGKILRFFESDFDSGRVTSTTIRLNAIIRPWELFLQNPILGHGATKLSILAYDYTKGMNTCTFVNWFAIYGIFFGGLMLIGLFLFPKAVESKIKFPIVTVIFLFVITMSENLVNNPILYILCLYGFSILAIARE